MEHQRTKPQAAAARGRDGTLKSTWRRIRKPLAQSGFVKRAVASLLVNAMRFTQVTNPLVKGSTDLLKADAEYAPCILALWHGQHFLAPFIYPRGKGLLAMVSRSADAELNAVIVQKLGLEAVRGSGGRKESDNKGKGGARALLALKKALEGGKNVAMIADIPHGTPRQSGLGIVTLARLSGRPIVPVAIATSRRKVLERSWDKTTISLPFGRGSIVLGEPVWVDADADEAGLDIKRGEVDRSLDAATAKAYALVDSKT